VKILVTGGLGYIGSHVVLDLVRDNHECVIIDNLSNSDISTLNKLNSELQAKIDFYKIDLLNQDDLDEVFLLHKFDAVMHFAGLKSVGESVSNPIKYYENNVVGSINLLKSMKKYACKKIIFSSSATVYGVPSYLPLNEAHSLNSINPYGETKIAIERFIMDLSKSDPEWLFGILRYFNPVGGDKSHIFGENPRGVPANIMPYICQVAAGKLKNLNIFGNDYDTIDGTGVRDYIHVVDLSQGHIKALEYLFHKLQSICVNLGTGKGYSVLQLVKTFEKVNNIKVPYLISARREGDIATNYADVEFAMNELDWSANFDLEKMCEDSWESQKKLFNF